MIIRSVICLYMYGNNFVNRWYFFHQFVLLNMPAVMKKARSASLKSIFTYTVFSPGRGLAGFLQEKTEMAH